MYNIISLLLFCFGYPALAYNARRTLESYIKQTGYLEHVPILDRTSIIRKNAKKDTLLAVQAAKLQHGLDIHAEDEELMREIMGRSRCGVGDIRDPHEAPISIKKCEAIPGKCALTHRVFANYVTNGIRLTNDEVIKYKITVYEDESEIGDSALSREAIDSAVLEAARTWSEPIKPNITAVDRADDDAHIEIAFYRLEHGDGKPFDGPGNVLGHAFLPGSLLQGALHLDADEVWEVRPGIRNKVDLRAVVLHELGHSLGLLHSPVKSSVMYAYYHEEEGGGLALTSDDIVGIQALYGAADGYIIPPPPPFLDDPNEPYAGGYFPEIQKHPQCLENIRGLTYAAYGEHKDPKSFLYAFDKEYFAVYNERSKMLPGYPKQIKDYWLGIKDGVDAALTVDYQIYKGEYHYRRVTYFYSGHLYFKFFDYDLVTLGTINTDLKLPFPIDAAFQSPINGKVYFIIGKEYYKKVSPESPNIEEVGKVNDLGVTKKVADAVVISEQLYTLHDKGGMAIYDSGTGLMIDITKTIPYCNDEFIGPKESRGSGLYSNIITVFTVIITFIL